MDILFRSLGVMIAWPWLALVPAGAFLALYRVTRRRRQLATAAVWVLYAIYEYAMRRRWLCSGECNIRVDLLLLYPALFLASVAALWSATVTIVHQRRGGTRNG